MHPFNFQPVIIIGAGRSGTNMLRDLLTGLPRFATWPCDEINYIWRYGNARLATDMLTPDHATDRTVDYIRKQFSHLAKRTGALWVVEKTCANSLRVDFVSRVLPEAKYIFIVRDGKDVALSAEKRWQAPLELNYVLKKARYVPVRDIPYYAARYLIHRAQKLINGNRRLPTWGPKCEDLFRWAQEKSLREICVHQWQACVEKASDALARLPRTHVHFVRYESFVENPVKHLTGICDFLGFSSPRETLEELGKKVHHGSVGKAANWQSSKTSGHLDELVRKTLAEVDDVWAKQQLAAA